MNNHSALLPVWSAITTDFLSIRCIILVRHPFMSPRLSLFVQFYIATDFAANGKSCNCIPQCIISRLLFVILIENQWCIIIIKVFDPCLLNIVLNNNNLNVKNFGTQIEKRNWNAKRNMSTILQYMVKYITK